MLYEDTSVDVNSDKRFHVELHFSPGAYADFDSPTFKPSETSNSAQKSTENNNSNSKSTPTSTKRLSLKKLALQTLPEPNIDIIELSSSPPDSSGISFNTLSG